jgi:hypothetical protein
MAYRGRRPGAGPAPGNDPIPRLTGARISRRRRMPGSESIRHIPRDAGVARQATKTWKVSADPDFLAANRSSDPASKGIGRP